MRATLIIVATGAALLVLASVAVFSATLELSLLDAVYFTVTTVTTVGYGDISLKDAPVTAKLFGVVVMVAGPASLAAGFGIMTDALLNRRFERLLGGRFKAMQDHIVICGIGNVGVRVLERCVELGEPVAVIERDGQHRFLGRARDLRVPIIVGDMRTTETLDQASIKHAKSIIACTTDDLANLEAALLARAEQPQIRVVLRMFNQSLARRLEDTLGVTTALSTSLLAAPAFAMAALDENVLGSFDLEGQLMLTVRIAIDPTHPWAQGSVADAARSARGAVLSLTRADGTRSMSPDPQARLQAGDRIVVCVPAEHRAHLPPT